MKELILVKWRSRWESAGNEENICVTTTIERARKYADELTKKYPDLYPHGTFVFNRIEFIGE